MRSRAFGIFGLAILGALVFSAPLWVRAFFFEPYLVSSAAMEPTFVPGDYMIVEKGAYGYRLPPQWGAADRWWFRAPTRGDVMVFRLPRDGRTAYFKRLVGLPGDSVQIKAGRLFINGKALVVSVQGQIRTDDRVSASGAPQTEVATVLTEATPEGRRYSIVVHGPAEPAANTAAYAVPAHCYFVLGDNRDNSADSRFDPGLPADDPALGGCGWDARYDQGGLGSVGVGFVPEQNLLGKVVAVIRRGRDGFLSAHPFQ